jgi:hypothetical protein
MACNSTILINSWIRHYIVFGMGTALKIPLVALAAMIGCTACVQGLTMNRAIYHSLEFGNDGKGNVENVEVTYDTQVVPYGTHSSFAPNHRTMYSEGFNLAVPTAATIRWTSADGKGHLVEAPMRSLVGHLDTFQGFQFYFVDDHVDIYRINAKIEGTKISNMDRTKVFSSGG